MIGEVLRDNPAACILLPAQITGWRQRPRIDSDKSCYLHASTAEAWRKLASQYADHLDPMQAFADELCNRHPDIVFQKAATHWWIMPLGDWAGMPRIYMDLITVPLYEEVNVK